MNILLNSCHKKKIKITITHMLSLLVLFYQRSLNSRGGWRTRDPEIFIKRQRLLESWDSMRDRKKSAEGGSDWVTWFMASLPWHLDKVRGKQDLDLKTDKQTDIHSICVCVCVCKGVFLLSLTAQSSLPISPAVYVVAHLSAELPPAPYTKVWLIYLIIYKAEHQCTLSLSLPPLLG